MTSPKSSPSMEDIHLSPVPGCPGPSTPYLRLSTPLAEEKTEEHIKLEDCDATLNTEPMEGPTNGEGGKGTVAAFPGDHEFQDCQHNHTVPQYIPDQSPQRERSPLSMLLPSRPSTRQLRHPNLDSLITTSTSSVNGNQKTQNIRSEPSHPDMILHAFRVIVAGSYPYYESYL
jgi:hypothetical protein